MARRSEVGSLWLVEYLRRQPHADLPEVIDASRAQVGDEHDSNAD